jgi:hypothetical protein
VRRPREQIGIARRSRLDGDGGYLSTSGVDEAGGVRVGVGVHANDGVDGFCEHEHHGRVMP